MEDLVLKVGKAGTLRIVVEKDVNGETKLDFDLSNVTAQEAVEVQATIALVMEAAKRGVSPDRFSELLRTIEKYKIDAESRPLG